jgi:acyl dehydratase
MPGRCHEDFQAGQVFEHAVARSVTQFDNIWHTCMTLNTQPLHLNLDFATRKGMYGKPLFNSIYTMAIVLGQTSELTRATFVELVGMTDIQFPRPVFAGDTLYSRTTVVDVTPDADAPSGVVTFEHEGTNQGGEVVMTCRRSVRLRSRAAMAPVWGGR